MRYEAERLRRADALAFGDTQWIQTGLSAALDALAALPVGRRPDVGPAEGRGDLGRWIRVGRSVAHRNTAAECSVVAPAGRFANAVASGGSPVDSGHSTCSSSVR